MGSGKSRRMILRWGNVYASRGVPHINIGTGNIDNVVEEVIVIGHYVSKFSFMSLLVDNISRR